MTEDNVRQMWSDAELDAALHDLHRDAGSEDALANARASLLAAAGGEHVERRMERPPAKKGGGSWRWITVAAAVTLLTGGLVVARVATSPAPPDVGGPVVPVDRPLLGPDELNSVDLPVPAHGFRHIVQSEWVLEFTFDGKHAAYVEQRLERWIPANPQGQWQLTRTQTANVRWVKGGPGEGLNIPGPTAMNRFGFGGNFDLPARGELPFPPDTLKPASTTPSAPRSGGPLSSEAVALSQTGGWDLLNANFFARLPTDPKELFKMLSVPDQDLPTGTASVTPGLVLQRVQDALEVGLANGAQRVALCQALAMFPGVSVRPGQTGPGGTRGLGFEVIGNDHLVLIVDPATAQVVSSAATSHNKTGNVLQDLNYVESTMTFSTSLKPGGN